MGERREGGREGGREETAGQLTKFPRKRLAPLNRTHRNVKKRNAEATQLVRLDAIVLQPTRNFHQLDLI